MVSRELRNASPVLSSSSKILISRRVSMFFSLVHALLTARKVRVWSLGQEVGSRFKCGSQKESSGCKEGCIR